ncbi:class I SAM-dependent methyltransferase [Oxalobacteraceae bacterium CAVE-383]|nr:class I SAM-dependent methyltransferase [Oxalobacteraceae bacterium CAVE-383]
MTATPEIHWVEDGQPRTARWRAESGAPAPKRVQIADDRTDADSAYRLACEGVGLLWRGDFQNARQLLQALARRIDRPAPVKRARLKKNAATAAAAEPIAGQAFHLHRQAQSQRARILGMLLLPHDSDHGVPLRRAPDVRQACADAYGPAAEPYVASMRELLGLIGAFEWRKNGIEVAALDARIHPHYGVFAPVRAEYVDLVAAAPLPADKALAFDIGTGTGVLAALLARRGFRRVIATDQDPRALACARENLARLDLAQVEVVQADLFPSGPESSAQARASLIICNPPWLPARPSSPIEHAVYDPDSRMLRGFLQGLPAHLAPRGEGWLILSDLAEHLELRSREALLAMFAEAGLRVIERHDIRPRHPRAADAEDVLHKARAAEVTSLWRLAVAPKQ